MEIITKSRIIISKISPRKSTALENSFISSSTLSEIVIGKKPNASVTLLAYVITLLYISSTFELS